MKFKARIVGSMLCISTSMLTLVNILDSLNSSGDNSIPTSRAGGVSKSVGDRRGYWFKWNDTEKHLDRHAIKTLEENTTGLAADQMNYPLGVKVGTLAKVVRENGTTVEQRVGNRYGLIKRIGGGIFGHIFLGIDMENGEKVAVKVDRSEKTNSTVSKEGSIYRILQGGEGFPTSRWSGRVGSYNILVMDLLGPNLQKYFELCRYKFSLKTVLLLANQMISRLEYLHYNGFIHRDLSPVNFVIGLGDKRSMVYIIDLGFSQRYRDPNTARHVPYRHVGYAGTERYCSLSAHEGYQQSRRDDMESLGYVLIYFLKGRLPWQGVKSKLKSNQLANSLQIKRSTTIMDLCKGLPVEFSQYFNISKSLKFEEEPDYSRLRNILKNAFQRQNFTTSDIFDWNVVNGTCSHSDEI